jgi:hypothetical protein
VVGTVDSDKLNATAINVGAGGGKPGVINVVDGAASVVARVGQLDTGAYGGWFKVFGAGGTGYSDAKVKTDTSGNLFINNAALSITAGSDTLSTGPTTFDATYSSLALTLVGGGYQTSVVTRGLVLYSGGSKIGALVRAPGGAWAELELLGSGYTLLSGNAGIRSDKGYYVGAIRVIDNLYQFIGQGVNCPAYAVDASNYKAGGVEVINTGQVFIGKGVYTPAYGVAASGFNPYVSGVQYFGVASASFTTTDGKTVQVRGGAIVSVT